MMYRTGVAILVLVCGLFSTLAFADNSRVYWSPDGSDLGSDAIGVYSGSSHVLSMVNYRGGVLAAFDGTGLGFRIHWSPTGDALGTGAPPYDGSSPVTAMATYKGGVLVAFSRAGGNGNRIFFSPDGTHLGGGGATTLLYDGSSPVTAMTAFNNGVMVAFSNAGGAGNRIWYSPDGTHLGGGQLVYDGSSPVRAMLAYRSGLLTAFTNAGPYGNRIHWSPDGMNPGGGTPVYDGSSPVTAMTTYGGGVLVAFTSAGQFGNAIYYSPDGSNLGSPHDTRYDGSTVVSAMLPFRDGVFTAFVGEETRSSSVWSKLENGFDKLGRWTGEQLSQIVTDIGNTPESWTACLRDVNFCARKNFNKLLSTAIYPILEGYHEYLVGQVHGQWKALPGWVVKAASPLYPGVDLGAVRYAEGINTIHGYDMTWESTIFFTETVSFANRDSVEEVLHELEHVGQYARRGGWKAFVSEYILSAGADIIKCRCFNPHDQMDIEAAAIAKEKQAIPPVWAARRN